MKERKAQRKAQVSAQLDVAHSFSYEAAWGNRCSYMAGADLMDDGSVGQVCGP